MSVQVRILCLRRLPITAVPAIPFYVHLMPGPAAPCGLLCLVSAPPGTVATGTTP